MRVLLVAVGTRGDVQPAIAFATRMGRDGARIAAERLAAEFGSSGF